jgi:O-antigen/teichoic acid export membrane protein
MSGIASRAVLLSLSRIANQGLMLLSPIILVRLLSMHDFGRYREFMVYATLLQSIAGMLINSSLTTFVPAHPEHAWRYVRQCLVMVGATSVLAVLLLCAADLFSGGALVGEFLVPLALYTFFFVNFDFWQSLWLAQKQAGRVMLYASGRLFMRTCVIVAAAAVSGDVATMIWSLVAFELLRVCTSAISWWRQSRRVREEPGSSWRAHIEFSLPLGLSNFFGPLNTRAGPLYLSKQSGPTALAEYTIGTYVQPLVQILRNSLSEALLPDLVGRRAQGKGDPLALWKRATVVYMILMTPAAVIVARHAETIITVLFSEDYLGAVPVMQIFSIMLLRECLDFGVLLRAAGRTRSFLSNQALSLVINVALLLVLVPAAGLIGAVLALVIARTAEAVFLGSQVCKEYGVRGRELLPMRQLRQVAVAGAGASLLLFVPEAVFGSRWIAIAVTVPAFLVAYAGLLRLQRLGEAAELWSGALRILRRRKRT